MSLTEVLSNPESISGDDARAVMEFEKMRFELSWRHFDFHARQRTQLFHFFIILTPFVFGGCFIVFKDRHLVGYWPCVIAPIAGACLSFIFFLLDRRNKQLYRVSEEALRASRASPRASTSPQSRDSSRACRPAISLRRQSARRRRWCHRCG